MTFLVTVSMGDCVILAADRAAFDISTGELMNEDTRKITRTAHGYITASGAAELIEPVKARFQAENPEAPDEMRAIIEDAQLLFLARHYGSPAAAEWVDRSSWKLTIPAKTGVTAAFTAPDGLRGLGEGRFMFTYPKSVLEAEQAAVKAIATQFKYRAKDAQTSREDVGHNLAVIMQAVECLKTHGQPVSAVIDFAVHHRNWREELTSEQLP